MLYNRKQLEKIEDKSLSPYGLRSKDTKGRQYPDHEPEYRTSFQRDRDRILHTTAFRRLEYKTQVFITYEGDYYRTRLTHTLEVAQIGRTLAKVLGVNEDLVEAICLSHDLGHSAFGHSGEATLDRLIKDHGGFNHNNQSFRIVTELDNRYPNFPGLNLTWEVREGIVKHETEYDVSDASAFNPELRGHVEAQIANQADELAYIAHDLDDGLRSGMISPKMLEGIALWEVLVKTAGWSGGELDELSRHSLIRSLIGLQVADLVEQTTRKIKESGAKSALEVQQLDYNVVCHGEEMVRRNRELIDFLYNQLYHHYRVVRMAVKADRILSDLFEAYHSEPRMLPSQFQEAIEARGLERTICDYLAGMTDRYAIDEHEKLFKPGVLP